MKKIVFILSLTILAACSTTRHATAKKATSEPEKPVVATTSEPAVDKTAITQGKALYEQHCGACHGLKNPNNYTEAQLVGIVPNMVQKTNRKAGSTVIDTNKEQMILKYLASMSKK